MARFSLVDWWHRWRPGPWRVTLIVPEADQVPEALRSQEAALVRSPQGPKWLAFDCPCGAGHRVMLNLDQARRPFWQVHAEAPLTLWPSVDMDANGRRCHYVIHRGRVSWVPSGAKMRRLSHDR